MKKKIPILLLTNDRPNMLEKVLHRIIKHTDWGEFDLWILDNFSTRSNKKIVNVFKSNYSFIKVYSTTYNQISRIQNEVINKLKSDIYIKIDDDILVSENWTTPLLNVYNRNFEKMSFGSVIMPVNGFGWVPFLEIMRLTEEFIERFPGVELKQGCMDVAIFNNKEVSEFIWNHCLDIDATADRFISIQNGDFKDLNCGDRYSIGAIIFSHKAWEDMGGWQVQDGYNKVLQRQKQFHRLAAGYKKIFNKSQVNNTTKVDLLADLLSGSTTCAVGGDEQAICEYAIRNGLSIPITTEGIVFHFSFGPTDDHIMNKVYPKIKF